MNTFISIVLGWLSIGILVYMSTISDKKKRDKLMIPLIILAVIVFILGIKIGDMV